jgi:hypothetical protein
MAYQRCLSEIKKAAGVDFSDRELTQILNDILERKMRSKSPRLSDAEGYKAAAAELSAEAQAAAAIERRNAILNLQKRIARRQFYEQAPPIRNPITGKVTPAAILGLEAKIAGVNAPILGGRLSVDAQAHALTRDYIVGMGVELKNQGLDIAFRNGSLDREWTRELAELNKADGKPGITGNEPARKIAEIVHTYQKLAVDDLNRAGAWIGEYEGYVTRQSHDPDRIRRAGFDAWRAAIADKLDPKTFDGVEDPERFLRAAHDALITGVHMTVDGMQGLKDPAFHGPGNVAKRLSQPRVLHFKDAESWLAYHEQFGRGTLAESVLGQLEISAKATALMREFGTNPRAEFEADIRYLEELYRQRGDNDTVMALRKREKALHNMFDEVDGTSATPVNRTVANIGRSVRAWNTMTKLGGVFFAGITDLPFKARELKYQGAGFLERYWNNIEALAHGFRSEERAAVYDALRAGHDTMHGHLALRFDAADTPPGTLAKLQNWFLKLTGHTYWVDAQRAGAEGLMARILGRQKDKAFGELMPESQRLLRMFGLDEKRWDLLRSVDWRAADGDTYLTPDVARRVSDADLEAHLRATGALGKDAPPDTVANKVAGLKRELELQLLSYFGDRSDAAIFTPGARERALIRFGTKPGTFEGELLRLMGQFKTWSVTAITRSLGRELYGYGPKRTRFAAIAGISTLIVETTLMGYLARALKDAARGRTPRDPKDPKAWMDAFAYGGGLGIYGDYIMGEYGREHSMLASMAGPTLGSIDEIADLWNRAKSGDDVAANALRFGINNTPFINLFYTRAALDYLVLYQFQEMLNPGFLRRYERTINTKMHQQFFISPSQQIPYGGGGGPFVGVR